MKTTESYTYSFYLVLFQALALARVYLSIFVYLICGSNMFLLTKEIVFHEIYQSIFAIITSRIELEIFVFKRELIF